MEIRILVAKQLLITNDTSKRPPPEVVALGYCTYYSGKKKQFTLKTQFATDGGHHIEGISVGVPGSKSDIKLNDELGTVERLPDGCEAQADKGYQGLDKRVRVVTVQNLESGEQEEVAHLIVKTPIKKPKGGELNKEQKAYNRAIGQVRVRVEHCIGWVKNWAIIATRFRCAHSIYTEVMQVVCGLVTTPKLNAGKQPRSRQQANRFGYAHCKPDIPDK